MKTASPLSISSGATMLMEGALKKENPTGPNLLGFRSE